MAQTLKILREELERETPNSKAQTPKKHQTPSFRYEAQGRAELRQVLECDSPLPLFKNVRASEVLRKSISVEPRASVWSAVHSTAFPAPWRSIFAAAYILLLCLPTLAAAPSTTNSLPPSDVDAWSIIPKRNIFNSRRSPAYVPSQREYRPASRIESFALVGTMDYHKEGPIAFFEGNRSDFHKVAKPNETIGGFKVVDIEPQFVKLAGPTNTVELRLGMQLRRENEGEWSVSERPESLEPAVAPSPTAHLTYQTNTPPTNNALGAIGDFLTGIANGELQNFQPPDPSAFAPGGQPPSRLTITTNAAPAVSSGGGSDSDVLQRLMMRRRQQENQ